MWHAKVSVDTDAGPFPLAAAMVVMFVGKLFFYSYVDSHRTSASPPFRVLAFWKWFFLGPYAACSTVLVLYLTENVGTQSTNTHRRTHRHRNTDTSLIFILGYVLTYFSHTLSIIIASSGRIRWPIIEKEVSETGSLWTYLHTNTHVGEYSSMDKSSIILLFVPLSFVWS